MSGRSQLLRIAMILIYFAIPIVLAMTNILGSNKELMIIVYLPVAATILFTWDQIVFRRAMRGLGIDNSRLSTSNN